MARTSSSRPSLSRSAEVRLSASASGKLDAWVVFSGNGAFEPSEEVFVDQTLSTGTLNVTQATGQAFAKTVEEWALANWVSDLPGFTAPPALRYKHWAFRTVYPRMNATCSSRLPASFPLVAVASAGPSINVKGVMWTGSGAAYQRALQGPSAAGFTVLFSDSTGALLKATVVPRLNVLRIR